MLKEYTQFNETIEDGDTGHKELKDGEDAEPATQSHPVLPSN